MPTTKMAGMLVPGQLQKRWLTQATASAAKRCGVQPIQFNLGSWGIRGVYSPAVCQTKRARRFLVI
jgi:hypothetical protein